MLDCLLPQVSGIQHSDGCSLKTLGGGDDQAYTRWWPSYSLCPIMTPPCSRITVSSLTMILIFLNSWTIWFRRRRSWKIGSPNKWTLSLCTLCRNSDILMGRYFNNGIPLKKSGAPSNSNDLDNAVHPHLIALAWLRPPNVSWIISDVTWQRSHIKRRIPRHLPSFGWIIVNCFFLLWICPSQRKYY